MVKKHKDTIISLNPLKFKEAIQALVNNTAYRDSDGVARVYSPLSLTSNI